MSAERAASVMCRECGYDLAALGAAERAVTCPECGEENDPSTVGLEPFRPATGSVLKAILWLLSPSLGAPAGLIIAWAGMEPVAGIVLLLSAPLALTASLSGAQCIAESRVLPRRRGRVMLLVFISGLAANAVLSVMWMTAVFVLAELARSVALSAALSGLAAAFAAMVGLVP